MGSFLSVIAGVRWVRIVTDVEKRRYATGASAGEMPPIEFILYSIIERDLRIDMIRQVRRDKRDDDIRQEGGKKWTRKN